MELEEELMKSWIERLERDECELSDWYYKKGKGEVFIAIKKTCIVIFNSCSFIRLHADLNS